MLERSDVIYRYDGSYDGLLCCVFASFFHNQRPIDIVCGDGEPTLYETRCIDTDFAKARRVENGILNKISEEALELVRRGFLTCHSHKETLILDFVRLCFRCGPRAASMLADDTVSELTLAVRRLEREAHQYLGFVRFSDAGGALVAEIEPKNFVLPLLEAHFKDRLPRDAFLIYDRTHAAALICQRGRSEIISVDAFDTPSLSPAEREFHALWKDYCESVAIRERRNPVCQRSHMQKRYWPLLPETDAGAPASRAELERALRGGERIGGRLVRAQGE
ncbi:MAG: TIGR03915 family putative DNA repair protein [Oscillospiraceae bacterium]|nr:TIGR03915 family putative DNA repair protein [Oscillospiraceae bacterium]